MKLHGRFTLPLIFVLVMALAAILWATVSSSSVTRSSAAQPSTVDEASLAEKATFTLDEGGGSRRVSGGVAEEFVAQLSGGAELGVAGKVGTALQLNGTSAYAATSGPVVDTTKSFSVSAWVKLDNKDRNYTFLSQAGNRASGFQLYYSKYYDKWVFNRHTKDTDDTAIIRSISQDSAQAGVWTQLTGVYDAAAKKIQLYVNGTPQTAADFTTPWRASGGLQIGRLHYRGAWQEHTGGLIDDVRTVQSAVTPTDVVAIAGGRLPSHLQELASFPLDEASGSTRASGGKGAGPVATLAGSGTELGAEGKIGTALHLNGTSGYAATSGPVVDTTKSFSVSAWVKLDNKDRNYTFLSQAGNRASGFQLYYSKYYDKWVFNRHTKDTDDTAIIRSISQDSAQAGVWTQLTGVYDAAAKKIQLYVNGTPQTAADFTTPWRARSALQIGRLFYKYTWQEHFAGTIDNIRIAEQGSTVQCSLTYTVGHRGAPEIAPENTIASLEAAADRGAEWVETDVQFTKDGQPVIMHDATVDRMTNGTGRIDQLTAAEISKLTVKGGGSVPTLEQVLASLKVRSTRLLLEIKGPQTSAAVEHALRLVAEAGMTERTMVQSFDEDVVRHAADSAHRTKVALLRSSLDPDPVATARKFSLSAYAVNFKGLSARPAAVNQLKAAGVQVFVWTVNRESEWQAATSWGVNGIITNRPDQFLPWWQSRCGGTVSPQ
ncbi:glycerophosphodiester phosphodiesterase family protein [Streptomyces sp. NPDC001339]|uniref:glycerophosphodiester phosphodiesterase family protein n=1 Tax=Streptomyces sp. NPDC001339 TaxID=3364563 RepID=UPI00368CDF86